jgi:hypothetical protein
MYGLPGNLELDFFRRKTLLQICIGRNDAIFNFDQSVSITVTSSVQLTSPDGNRERFENFPKAACALAGLANQIVLSARGNASGTLTLEFSDGSQLEIFDDSREFESYTIRNGEQLIIV